MSRIGQSIDRKYMWMPSAGVRRMGAAGEWLFYVWDWHLRSQLLHAISHLSFPYIYFLPTATEPCFPRGEFLQGPT